MSNQSARNIESTYGKNQLNSYVLLNNEVITSGAGGKVPTWSLEGSDHLDGAIALGGGGELNFQKEGVYVINGYILFSPNAVAVGVREVFVNLASGLELTCVTAPLKNNENIAVPFTAIARQGLGDVIRVRAVQTQGTNLNLIGKSADANLHCRFSIYRLN